MAQTSSTIEVPMPILAIKIKVPRAYGRRIWLTSLLIGLAAKVSPHEVEIEIVGKTKDAETDMDVSVLPTGWTFKPLSADDDLENPVADHQDRHYVEDQPNGAR